MNTTKPTRSRPHRQQEARPPRLPTKLGASIIEETAPTHPSHSDNRVTEDHEGPEPLGNAAPDPPASVYTEAGPEQPTDIRPTRVNNSHPRSLLKGPRKPVAIQPKQTVSGDELPGLREYRAQPQSPSGGAEASTTHPPSTTTQTTDNKRGDDLPVQEVHHHAYQAKAAQTTGREAPPCFPPSWARPL